MLDEKLLEKFEDGSLPIGEFHHEEHIRIALLYLRKYPVVEVLGRFSAALQRYAAAHGKSGLYHETISWAYIFIINERLARCASEQTWEEFKQSNLDLFATPKTALLNYYRAETIASNIARHRFIMPDRCWPCEDSYVPIRP